MKSREEIKVELREAIEGLDSWDIAAKTEELYYIVEQESQDDVYDFESLIDGVQETIERHEYYGTLEIEVLHAVWELREGLGK